MHSLKLLTTILPLIAATASVTAGPILAQRADFEDADFIDPRKAGGRMLDASAGLGEPLNVIISGKSTPEILTPEGSKQYFQAIGFVEECLGLHLGSPQTANLGDGRGELNETSVIRERIGGIPILGTCLESLTGGNHFRVFPQAGTNALFLATSKEEDLDEHHNIVPNGYDLGRDLLVKAAQGTHHGFDGKNFKFNTYETEVKMLSGLLEPGTNGINHDIAIDGQVAMLTVRIK
ncbi:hypothetical protein MKEN_00720600 [Mycena kentingensis (nom. inval.)]|nr:hypothetical protein MKEN_00720600 [Mycena kentingensis (nom. inval.)]